MDRAKALRPTTQKQEVEYADNETLHINQAWAGGWLLLRQCDVGVQQTR